MLLHILITQINFIKSPPEDFQTKGNKRKCPQFYTVRSIPSVCCTLILNPFKDFCSDENNQDVTHNAMAYSS